MIKLIIILLKKRAIYDSKLLAHEYFGSFLSKDDLSLSLTDT